MRLRLPLGRIALALALLLFALAATLPLRLAIGWLGFGERGLAARAASGSVWAGALRQAQVGPVALGDVRARLNLLPLLLGRARLSLRSADEAAPIAGAVTVTRNGIAFDDVSGRFRIGGALPLAALDLQDVSARFASGRCVRAEGRVRATAAGALAGSALAGNARCDGAALLLPLAGPGGAERLDVRLSGDGRWRIDLFVRAADPAAAARLAAAGLRPSGSGYATRIQGEF